MQRKKRQPLTLAADIKDKFDKIVSSRIASVAESRRAKIMLMSATGKNIAEIVRELQTNRPLVERCLDKAHQFGPLIALKDLPRSGCPTRLTSAAKDWVLHIACSKPVDFGYAAETWTYSEMIKHITKECRKHDHGCLEKLGKGQLNKILSKSNIKPHKISYYLEKKDPEFEQKMAQVLFVYKEVAMINDRTLPAGETVTVSYDEKPGIQAIKNISPQLPPVPGKHQAISRDYEYKRLGTLSLLAGIDLHTGRVIPLVKDRHRSGEFIEFLSLLDAEYPSTWKIRIILDNHSAHISRQTREYLDSKKGRFEFVFTPKHGSWLNMIEMFFSKLARGALRRIRVERKAELKDRIYLAIEEINADPVVFRWSYKMDEVSVV
jgi:transposase/uncharacterized protein YwbE